MRQRISTRISVLTACIAGVLSVACIGPAAADLLPHRAVYTLSIGAGSAMSGGAGEMRFEVKDVCDGWASDLKVELTLAGEDGAFHRLGWNQVTWEAKDGSRYRYFMRELANNNETERRRGEARRDTPDAIATVTADLPVRSEFKLPAGVLFPMQHTAALIAASAAGESYVLAEMFDGSVGDHAIEVGAGLGPSAKDWKNPGKAAAALKDVTSFPVALAFFISESPEGLPDTEQRQRLYANGVFGHLMFTVGDIQVQARLDEFEALKPEGC